MKTLTSLLTILALATLTACGKPEQEVQAEKARAELQVIAEAKKVEAAQDALTEQRSVAKVNSEWNAQMYKSANPRFTADYSIVSRSDTSQSLACPQGDGWAELSIMRVDPADAKKVDKTVLMCSTFDASIGCFRKEDFQKDKNLANQDGQCNAEIPKVLKPIRK